MKNELKRREFLTSCYRAGMACCAMMVSQKLVSGHDLNFKEENKINPKKLNYCGYKCPASCSLLKATVENNIELKKKAYESFKIKEKFGIEFDQEKVFCWGCKTLDKPVGITVNGCTVRNCAISKKIDCCIECNELRACKKELWEAFPKFKAKMVELQKKYLSTQVNPT
jgi:hypothetical protein